MQVAERIVKARGVSIPALGLGTWQLEGERCRQIVRGALQEGYRHIDTAQAYFNEEQVGAAVRESGVGREEIFLTTKVSFDKYAPEELRNSVLASLERLQTDFVDLLLLHWPVFTEHDMKSTVEALVRERDEGRARSVGVSNFTVAQLVEAQEYAGDCLLCNQVEYHPLLDQKKLLKAMRDRDMVLAAYSPLARGKIFEDPIITHIAGSRGVSPAQVALAWLINQDGVVAIPKASSMDRVKSNLAATALELSEDELATLDTLGTREGRVLDPDFAPEWD